LAGVQVGVLVGKNVAVGVRVQVEVALAVAVAAGRVAVGVGLLIAAAGLVGVAFTALVGGTVRVAVGDGVAV
jgi:molybdate-binding protein